MIATGARSAWRASASPSSSNFLDELPRTAVGKIQKHLLKASLPA